MNAVMNVVAWFINILLQWYVWVPIVLILVYMTWRNYQKVDAVKEMESALLVLEIPRANDKSELAAEQLFASLHGILRDAKELRENNGFQEHLSFEIASVAGRIRFYVWTPKALQSFVEGQIYAQYPQVQIHAAEEDYVTHERQHSVIYTSELVLNEKEYLPIKTFQSFEVDPLAGVTGTLAKLEDTGEELWIQILLRPVADDWHKSSERWVHSVKNGSLDMFGGFASWDGAMKWLGGLFEALWQPPEQGEGGKPAVKEISDRDKTRLSEAETKATKLGYHVKIRVAYLGESTTNAKLRMQAIVGTFKQYNSTNLNGFRMAHDSFRKEDLAKYKARLFADRGYILNIEEVASVFHLPHTNVETPNIVWASTKTAEPPAKLPVISGNDANDENISAFGLTNFRGINHQFGMLRYDRSRHIYIIGQTGAGKSGTLELLALSDIFHGQGYAIIDPHGDFAINNMKFIPGARMQDVVYFNPADTEYPLGFNPLEVTNPAQKTNISSEVIGVLKRMFGESWGPRLEYILRYTILALLDRPETTMLDITRMLTDKKFRKDTLSYCKDTVVLQFWNVEFASWTDKFQSEAIAPVLNKVGAFTANPVIRNIIGQPRSTFNIRQIMDEGKILIVNLSKGLIGEDNAGILGSFLVTKIQLAAMSRSDIPNVEDRRPFFLYVDEFQNFATDSFATILSEARKYGLNLTVANQYISQMSEGVRDAVFGNVGTMISFRVSADDAPILGKQFEPQFEPNDLLQMHNRNFIINMVINGEKAPAFSARTLNLPTAATDNTRAIIENTRVQYSQPRAVIEQNISDQILPPQNLQSKGKGNPEYTENQKKFLGIEDAPAIAEPQQPKLPRQVSGRVPRSKPEENRPRIVRAEPIPEVKPDEPHRSDQSGDSRPAQSDEQPKRKRTRTRKRKSSTGEGSDAPQERKPRETSDEKPNEARAKEPETPREPQKPRETSEPGKTREIQTDSNPSDSPETPKDTRPAPIPKDQPAKVKHTPIAKRESPKPAPEKKPTKEPDPTILRLR